MTKEKNGKKDIKSMMPEELEKEFELVGLKRYRVFQVISWLASGSLSFDEMTDLPKELRVYLKQNYKIINSKIAKKHVSPDGTTKFLLELPDGNCVESVLMKYKYGCAICVSTQVGCRMGCRFCASSTGRFCRNLEVSEIISQIEVVQKSENIKVSNITLMGIGEPMDNYENVVKFLKIASLPKGMNIGARRVSISTCGIAEKIKEFADERLGTTLSVSLHAADDCSRDYLMPINRKYNLDCLMKFCRYYILKTSRRISFEYMLLDGVNDSKRDALKISDLLRGMIAHVNLIPANNLEIDSFKKHIKPSSAEKIEKFAKTLLKLGLRTTVRRTLGADIGASCGQLRARSLSL
ncbi:MAG: 23S rRNA (adenine(2503)-C(2))-methyltransferase RlmN [Oscillospiraceae bacterium]|nr:23S rRNA (adenine(2503)-C(2))-methyltransferase RlmN [Oscillospiraceae bacterium]